MADEKKKRVQWNTDLHRLSKKIDQVLNLQLQQQALDFRMNAVEACIKDLKNNQKKNIERWLNPLISAVVSGLVAFVLIKVGLK